jgi:hypothetical protein
MAHRYVTTAEVNLVLGTSGEDSLIDTLIDGAEALFDGLIGSETGLISSVKTEDFAVDDTSKPRDLRNRVFDLGTYRPTAVATINGASAGVLDTDFTLTGQRLEFRDFQQTPNVFPFRFRIVYTSGFASIADIPADIKTAVKYIVGALYNTRKAQGIASFKQDLLSVNYRDTGILDTILDPESRGMVAATAANYTVYSVIS